MAQCEALTKKGDRCRGGAMAGQRYCGPHIDQMGARPIVPVTKGVKRFVVDPDGQKRSVGKKESKAPCPDCGLVVHRAGTLISYHAGINGCRRWDTERTPDQ